MIDFSKFEEAWYAKLDDEARARVDAHRAAEARAEETAVEVTAKFERYASRDRGKTAFVLETYERPIRMRIEEREGNDGQAYEVLAFKNVVTGHENYRLDEDLCKMLSDPEERRARPDWYVCAGNLKYDSCRVSCDEVENYLRDVRPHLFEPAPAPGV